MQERYVSSYDGRSGSKAGTVLYVGSDRKKATLKELRESTLKSARAWAIKEFAMSPWHYVSKTWARKGWERWLSWAVRSRLSPMNG